MPRKISDETRRKNAERLKLTYRSVSCSVPVEIANLFKEYCEKRGESVHANLKQYIERCINRHNKK